MKHIREDSRLRRAIFVYVLTIFCLLSSVVIVFVKDGESMLAARLIEYLIGLVEWLASLYLGVSLLDRSGVMHGLAERLRTPPESKETRP